MRTKMKITNTRGLLLLGFFLLLLQPIVAQKEANNWYFGNNAGLTFNTLQTKGGIENLPTPLKGPLFNLEGCFTISDKSGKFLLAGDGSKIYSQNSNGGMSVVENYTSLGGNNSTVQSGTIIPVPGSATRYYVFSLDNNYGSDGLQYAVIDMSIKNRDANNYEYNGGYISKNNTLMAGPLEENLAAVRKTGSKNFWIICRKQTTTTSLVFYIWEATADRVKKHSETTFSLPTNLASGQDPSLYITHMKFSSDGTRFMSVGHGSQDYYYYGSFDPKAGTLSNVKNFKLGGQVYASEFSPDGKYVYFPTYMFTQADGIRRVAWDDLIANGNDAKQEKVSSLSPYNLQLGPDGRIYGVFMGGTSLYVIENPNEPISENLKISAVSGFFITGTTSQLGLPTFSASFFSGEADPKPFVCKGNESTFRLQNVDLSNIVPEDEEPPTHLEWNWGEKDSAGNPITEIQPIVTGQTEYSLAHTYSGKGEYEISITPIILDASNQETERFSSFETIEANVVDCQIQVNRMIRVNVDNGSTQVVKHLKEIK